MLCSWMSSCSETSNLHIHFLGLEVHWLGKNNRTAMMMRAVRNTRMTENLAILEGVDSSTYSNTPTPTAGLG